LSKKHNIELNMTYYWAECFFGTRNWQL